MNQMLDYFKFGQANVLTSLFSFEGYLRSKLTTESQEEEKGNKRIQCFFRAIFSSEKMQTETD